ncbi:MAG: SDR family NAD(P)-dependent oxidoreductase [Oligoflexus sp.]
MNRPKQEDIAIIGISCLYPGAKSPLELWENILAKRQQFRRMPDERLPLSEYYDANVKAPDKTYGQEAALIDGFRFDWSDYRVPKKTFESTDIVHWLALHVALQALEDAGYSKDTIAREQCGVILGNTLTGEWTRANAMRTRWPYVEKVLRETAAARGLKGEAFQDFINSTESAFKSAFPTTTEDTLSGALSNTIAGRICNFLDLHGGGYTVDGACSSSLIAVIQAARNLANHDLDIAFAGGIDISLDTFELIGFAKTGALTKEEMRVYDKRASGFTPGEGCGFVILKRLEDAKRDGDRVYAVLKGWSLSSDGKGGLTAPSVDGQAKAIAQTYNMAGYDLSDCHFVEGHGTGTPLGDRVEVSALAKVFGEEKKDTQLGLTSLKSIVGHTKAAAGIGAFIKAIIAVNRRVMPPLAGCEMPSDLFANEAQSLYPLIQGQKLPENTIVRAGVSAMGFGGINTHVTLESSESVADNLQPDMPEEVIMASYEKFEAFPFSAHTASELVGKVREAQKIAARISRAEMVDYAADLARHVKASEPWKASVVAEKPTDLVQRLKELEALAQDELQIGEIRALERVFISRKKDSARVAFVFPGQGSQYLNMGRQLIKRHEWAHEDAVSFENVIRDVSGESFFDSFDIPNSHRLSANELREKKKAASQTEIAQPGICLTSSLWQKKLKRLGITPHTVAGHSLGELTAFWAAGAISSQELASLSAWRGLYMAASAEKPGKMAMLPCNEEQAKHIIEQVDGYVAIANLNGPQQTIIAGDAAAIDQVIEICQPAGVGARELNVSNAFHSKLMNQAAEEFAKVLQSMGERSLGMNMISGIDGQKMESTIKLAEYLPKQILSQVNYIALLNQLKTEHDLILEVGPGKVLSQLNKNLIGDSKAQVYSVDDGYEGSLELKLLISASFCMGVRVKWDQLYQDRLVRPFVETDKLHFIENPCERPLQIDAVETSLTMPEVSRPSPAELVAEQPVVPAQAVVPMAASGLAQIEALMVSEVHELTGFDHSTITMNLRILDDLNMDSIKAGELISNIGMKLGLAGEGDFGDFFNATLGEIAVKLHELQGDSQSTIVEVAASPAQAPAPSLQAPAASAKPVAEAAPVKPVNLLSRHVKEPWVRTMVESFVERPQSTDLVQWAGAKVAVIYDQSFKDVAFQLAAHLESQGSELDLHVISEQTLQEKLNRHSYEHIIALPQLTSSILDQQAVHAMVETLHKFTRIGRKPQRPSLSFIQFSEAPFARGSEASEYEFSFKSWLASLSTERSDLRIRGFSFATGYKERASELINIISGEIAGDENLVIAHIDAEGRIFEVKLGLVEGKDFGPSSVSLSGNDVIVVAGGAKGITAACGLELAKKYGCKMILIGSSALPENEVSSEIHETLAAYAKEGLEAKYYQCDLLNQSDVLRVISEVKAAHGDISGVIFGAGVNKPGPANTVAIEQAYREVDIKVLGAYHLYSALDGAKLQLFVSLTSVIGVTGMPGNTWYALANESLDLLTRKIKAANPQAHAVSLAYSVWSDIGMGAKLGSVDRLEEKGIGSISPAQGIERFMKAVQGIAPDHQQVVISRMGQLQSRSSEIHGDFEKCRFIEDVLAIEPQVETLTKVRLTTERDTYLLDHNFKGTYLFPTVFGLEAMAQNVLFVTGMKAFKEVAIEDISLAKPITVGKQGTVISIWTEVLERQTSDEPLTVRAGIRCEKSGFKVDHFSAVFKFSEMSSEDFISFDRSLRPLGVDPTQDLYGKILFQGPKFQQLKEIFQLESDDENEGMTIFHSNYSSDAEEGHLVLGDPYFRDSLLQSAQLIIPRYQCLPIKIQNLKISQLSIQDTTKRFCLTEVHRADEKRFKATITVVNENGQVLEVMENYNLQLVNKIPELPRAAELIDKRKANTLNLRSNLRSLDKKLQAELPHIMVFAKDQDCEALYHQELRYYCDQNQLIVPASLPKLCSGQQLVHCDDRRLFVNVTETAKEFVCSLSQDDFRHVDLQILDAQWQARYPHDEKIADLKQLESMQAFGSGKVDSARIDGILALLNELEVLSIDDVEVKFLDKHAMHFIIKSGERQVELLSSHVLNGNDRVYTIAVAADGSSRDKLLLPYRKISEVLRIEAEPYGPQNQSVFVHSFIPDFKAFSNLGRSIYFSHFFNWMGSARELSSVPVLDKIRELTESGRWGLVTNWASIKVLGECRNKDRVVQARMWCGRIMGAQESSVTLAFDWVSRGPDGIEERIATGYMGFTWVEILGHGIVKPAPFPDYYRDFIDSMIAQNDEPDRYIPAAEPLADLNPGESLFVSKKGPNARPVLYEKTFETSLFDANLVGNLYFGNYSIWMGKTRDFFFQKLMPSRFMGVGEQGEFRCTDCKIQHLREAMPFDDIKVRMSLSSLHEEGMDLYFEFYKVNENGNDEKLAYGDHRIVWTKAEQGKVQSVPLPEELMACLEEVINNQQLRGVS